jgi:hypothetical protein
MAVAEPVEATILYRNPVILNEAKDLHLSKYSVFLNHLKLSNYDTIFQETAFYLNAHRQQFFIICTTS